MITATTSTDREWTEPRRRALAVFATNPSAQISTRTSGDHARIHWPAAAWLLREGLIRRRPFSDWVELTARGTVALTEIGSTPPATRSDSTP